MSTQRIQLAISQAAKHLADHPQDARAQDAPAVAVLDSGLRCQAQGPGGASMVSDMPASVGGGGDAPTPGWLLRAALANCDATMVAMRAAQLGIALSHLEVRVASESDNRGLLGVDDSVPAGPLSVQVSFRLAADGVPEEQLRELVHWAEQHSPVGDALRRSIPVQSEILIGG
ncbi:OsmC family protein [Variovorax sp. OV329]|uniref:OsmC family protein n=1 Tax=Variovorax sp. OV329 TaxID=1882825 RepID=UPI0008EBC455|nr:OsmC family protein [Variovorax sp. OV329]SFM72177.1 Uncharacterized OsmC-related protein [Variovorax sp. OV329]